MEYNMVLDSNIVDLIINQGFAIAVALYLLWERTVVTKELLGIMSRLTTILDKLEEKFERDKK